ncbi:MerR family transcriptional regulator [Candidatus Omnitrophota bacterium]
MIQPERYYTIMEVASVLGISKQTLIRYENKSIFPKAKRNNVNRWREYTLRDIRVLRKILGREALVVEDER